MRQRIITAEQLWLHLNTQKTWLVEPEPVQILTSWTGPVDLAYTTPWAGGLYSDTDFLTLQQDGVDLTRVLSLAACKATAGTCFLDHAAALLYVRGIADASPATSLMVIKFRQFFSLGTSGTDVEECIFQPADSPYPVNYKRLLESVPGFSQRLPDSLFGKASITIGNLRFSDGLSAEGGSDGPMSVCIKNYIYFGQRCVCRVGGEDLPYSQYTMYWNGIMQDPAHQNGITEIEVKDVQARLEKKLPSGTYTLADYPNAEDSVIGKPKQIGYGVLRNIKPTLINKLIRQYKFLDHASGGIVAARWMGVDVTGNVIDIDLANSTFRLSANANGDTTIDCWGYKADGVTLVYYGQIAQALLLQALDAADIDSASFDAIDTARPYQCGLYCEGQKKINDLLDDLDETYLCFHATDRSGRVFAQLFDFGVPVVAASFVNNETCMNLREKILYSKVYKTIRFGYSKNWTVQPYTWNVGTRQDWSWAYKYLPDQSNLTSQLYGCEDTLVVDSLLSDSMAAAVMASLRADLHMMPWIQVSFDAPLRPYAYKLGDFIEISGCRYSPEGVPFLITAIAENTQSSLCAVTAITPAAGAIG